MPVPKVSINTSPSTPFAADGYLGEHGGLGIVHDRERSLARFLEERVGVAPEPALVHVRGRVRDAVPHDAGVGTADRSPRRRHGFEVRDDLVHNHRAGLRGRWLRCFDSETVVGKDALAQIDRRSFDATPADIDTEDERLGGAANRCGPGGRGALR
jgi:hypothetical protein